MRRQRRMDFGIDQACSCPFAMRFLDRPELRESGFALLIGQLVQPELFGPVQRRKRDRTRTDALDVCADAVTAHRHQHQPITRGMRNMKQSIIRPERQKSPLRIVGEPYLVRENTKLR